jgi:hypothetical protein
MQFMRRSVTGLLQFAEDVDWREEGWPYGKQRVFARCAQRQEQQQQREQHILEMLGIVRKLTDPPCSVKSIA